jgi:hypothetical protein
MPKLPFVNMAPICMDSKWRLVARDRGTDGCGASLRAPASGGAPEEIRTPDPQIRSLVLYSGAAICLIIACSSAPTLSNKIIQKGLAFGRDWSGSVVNSGR